LAPVLVVLLGRTEKKMKEKENESKKVKKARAKGIRDLKRLLSKVSAGERQERVRE
jgi:hypothetical protein